ncbi:hypothetical protein BDY24DRAFT_115777 [Mrakia frigida]|uniref:NAP domain-containing protein n=1 Tax=Mrakia frigida TaxID=29902 RepID=UPI003FCBF658
MSSSLNIPSKANGVPQTPANSFASPGLTAPGSTQPTVEDVAEEGSEDDEEQTPASMLANNPALAALVQSKLSGLVGKSSGYVENLPAAVRTRINGLKGVQVEHAKIETQFQLEILALEKKFATKYAPLYSRRSAIISGEAEPTAEEIAAGEAADSDDEDDEARVSEIEDDDDESAAIKGIPQFWLTALQNHQGIADLITERDEEALESLTDIKLAYLEDAQPGFKLVFKFGPNAFFENAELEKTYYYQEEVGYGGDFVYERAEGTAITWKADQDLTKTVEVKKQRNKTTNKTRIIKKVIPADSFFNFFSPPSPPTMESLEAGDVDEEELEALDERLELDYQIGEDLKERIIP